MEPACAVLEFPVSTYYAVKRRERQPSAREARDEQLKEQIMRVWEDRRKGRRVYGARKVWLQLRREGIRSKVLVLTVDPAKVTNLLRKMMKA